MADLKLHYSWSAISSDDPKATGKPDSTLLNRHEGYEVLHFINRLATSFDWKNKASGLKAEEMIRNKVPSNQRSHAHVKQWIVDHWDD
jgi:hypothetical protein